MALFGFGKERKGEDALEQVLAYLEDAQRVRVPSRISDDRGRETSGQLIGLSEAGALATFQVQAPLHVDKGARLLVTFILDGLRIGGRFTLASARSGQMDLAFPDGLELLERRKKPRAKLNPREGATLTALTGLFEGLGLTGIIENLSEGGARMRVERAMEIRGERKQALHTSLIQPGHAFGVIRISKLPRLPGAWEMSGQGVYLEGSSAALFLGLTFNSFPAEAMGALRSLIASRVAGVPTTLPPKTRRSQEPEPAAAEASAPARPAAEPAPPATPAEASEPVREPAAAPPGNDLAAEPSVEPAASRNTALLRLKKRARSVLVVATPGNVRDLLLLDHLTEEGYGRVAVAHTLQDLLGQLESPPSLLLIEDGVAELQGLDLVEALQRIHDELPPMVLALEEISTATVLAARRAGVGSLLVKPYELDDAFSAILESALGL